MIEAIINDVDRVRGIARKEPLSLIEKRVLKNKLNARYNTF